MYPIGADVEKIKTCVSRDPNDNQKSIKYSQAMKSYSVLKTKKKMWFKTLHVQK